MPTGNLVLDELERLSQDPRLRQALMRMPDLEFEGLATAPGVGLEESPGVLPELLGQVGRGIAATPETAATLLSGGLSFVGGGYAGIAKRLEEVGRQILGLPPPETSAVEDIEEAMAWTYQPRGETAQESVALAMKPVELAQDTSKWWGDKVEQATGSPSFGATVASMLEATFLVGIPEAIKMPAITNVYRTRMGQLRGALKNAIRKDMRVGDTAYSNTSNVLQQIIRESEEAGVNLTELRQRVGEYKKTAISGEPGREAVNAEAQAAMSSARSTMHELEANRARMGIDVRRQPPRSGNAVIDELNRMERVRATEEQPVETVRPTEVPTTVTRPRPVIEEPTTDWSAPQKVDGNSYQFRVGDRGLSEVQHKEGRPFNNKGSAATVARSLKKNGIGEFEPVQVEGGYVLREKITGAKPVEPIEALGAEGPLAEIPEFESTGEALEFGAKATEAQLQALERRRAERTKRLDELNTRAKAGDEAAIDEAFSLSFKNQFDREAIEVQREPGRYKAGITEPYRKAAESKFDTSTTDTAHWDSLLKSGEARIEMMSPDEYLRRAAKINKMTVKEIEGFIPAETIADYAGRMQAGEKAPMPILDLVEASQEGRARALAARSIGEKEIPVVVREKPKLEIVKPKRAVTPERLSERHGVEYQGLVEDATGDQYYRFYDPQVGKQGYRNGIIDIPVEDLKTLKSEVEALRDLNAEGARAEDLAAATIAKTEGKMSPGQAADAYNRWKEGDTNVVIEDVEATIIDEINRRSPGDFDNPTDYREYVSQLEEVLGDIRKTREQRAAAQPVFRRYEHKPITDPALLKREMAKTETEFLDQLRPDEVAALEEQMASEIREVEARGLPEVWSDIIDFFGEFDEGSMSFKPLQGPRKPFRLLSDDQKAAILRVMNDARIAGVETARFLKETLLLADKDVAVIEQYVREAMNERLKGSSKAQGSTTPASISPYPPADETPIVKNPPKDGPIQEIPITEREFTYVRDVPDLRRGQITAGLENPERTFRTLDTTFTGDPFKEMLYWPYQAAEKKIALEWENNFKPMLKELKQGLSWKDRKEIGAFAIAQQERGAEILKSMGVQKVPELSPKQMDVYRKLRSEFETFFDRINYVRQRIGKKPLKKVDNYFTFLRTFSLRDRMGAQLNPVLDSPEAIFNAHKAIKATPFRFAKVRAKLGVLPVELDPFTIFETYAQTGLRHIHVSPIVAKVRALRTPFKNVPVFNAATGETKPGSWHMQWRSPNVDEFLMKWSDHIAGMPSFKLPRAMEQVMHRMNRNMTVAVLGANLRSAGIQVSALRNTWVELGSEYTAKGIASLFDPEARNKALQKSSVLTPRMFDAAVADAKRVLGAGRISEGQKVVADLLMSPLRLLDMQTARATWQGAYLLAKDKLAMNDWRAARYADDVVTRTQASAMAGDIAPVQRSALGRWITLFQTFGINDWGYLTRDVLGLTGNPTSPKVFRKAMGYIAATTAMNILFEDIIGVNSPFPTPIRAFSDALENNESTPSATLRAAKELVEPIPLIGGGARYGTTPFGPNVQLVGETFALTNMYPESIAPLMKALNKPYYELAGKWLGAPGTSQIMKSMRAHKRGESTYGTIMGSYTSKGRKTSVGMKELSGLKSL